MAELRARDGELFAFDDDFTDPWNASEVVVLLHGFVRNARLWRSWVPYLGRTHRVLRPDLPGCGSSPDPGPGHEHTTDELVAQLLDLFDRAEVDRVHFVGEGVGGAIGAALTVSAPDRVQSLTLISEPVNVSPDIQTNHAAGFPTWHEGIEQLGMREWWLRAHAEAGDLVGDDRIDGYIADEIATVPPHVAVALARWAPTWDLRDLLPQIQVPVLFVWAEHARWAAEQDRDALTVLPAHGRQYLVRGVSTQLPGYIYPDLVAPVVREFITATDESG